MAFCTGCGASVLDDAKFCSSCGKAAYTPLGSSAPSGARVPPSGPTASGVPVPPSAPTAGGLPSTPPPGFSPVSGPEMNAVQKGWRWFRGRSIGFQIISWILVALVALGTAGSANGSSKTTSPPHSAGGTTASEPTTTTATPVDVTNTTAAVATRVKQTFPKATVSCDGSSGQAVCSVTLNDFLNTAPQTGTGITAAEVLSGMALPTLAAENKAQAKAEAKAKAKRLARQRAAARAAALRKIGTPVAREQAIQAAQSYLDMGSGFSRAGLIQQLSSSYGSGFTTALATFAVDNVHANWNQQAVLSAKSYLSMGGFSRDGLIQQLTSSYGEQFTYAQAVYAVNKVGL
jgi:hypothetical protein